MKIRVAANLFIEALDRCVRVAKDDPANAFADKVRLALDLRDPAQPLLQLSVNTVSVCIDTVVGCQVEAPGDPRLINCAQLHTAAKNLEQSQIGFRIEINDTHATLRDGRQPAPRSYRIPAQAASQQSDVPKATGTLSTELPSSLVKQAIESTLHSAVDSEGRPHLCLIFLNVTHDHVDCLSLNGHTASRRRFDSKSNLNLLIALPTFSSGTKGDSFIRAVAQLAESKEPLTITMTPGRVFVESLDTMVCSQLPVAYNIDFVAWFEQPTTADNCLIDREEFERAIGAVVAIARFEDDWNKRPCVQLAEKGGVLTVSATSKMHGGEDHIPVTVSGTAGFKYFVDPTRMRNALHASGAKIIRLVVPSGIEALKFGAEDGSFTCLIAGMAE